MLSESDRATRVTRTWLIDAPGAAPRKLWERKQQDRYTNPGMPMMRPGRGADSAGRRRDLSLRPGRVASGRSSLPRSPQSEIARHRTRVPDRRQELRNGRGAAVRRRQAAADAVGDEDRLPELLPARPRGRHEGARSPQFKDPAPQLTGIQKQLVTYDRKDGVKLSATVYLPPDYKPGTRLPFVLWAYPAEFTDADTASQVVGSPNRFTTISRRVAPAVPHAGLRRDGQPDDADRRRGRDGERHLRRAARGERRGGHQQDRRHGRGRSRPGRRRRATATARS